MRKGIAILSFLTTKKVTLPKWLLKTYFLLAVFLGGIFAIWFVGNSIFRVLAANDISASWNFGSSGDFTLGSTTGIEVSNNSVKLKVQNYEPDSDTKLLLHLDESSGNPTDSSPSTNSATANNISYVTGKFNNAATLGGALSYFSVADSSSLSLVQSNTIETWIKMNSSYPPSQTVHKRQMIVDKGVYKLYLDNETGKITYELAPSNTDSWAQVAGGNSSTQNEVNSSWDLNGKLNVEASVNIGNDIYVGLGNGASDGEVWKWNGSVWTQIGGDGLNSGWAANTYEEVYALETDGTNLYAGTGLTAGDGDVWKWNGSVWTQIGGDGLNSGWAASTYEYVTSLTYTAGTLYAGTGSSANDAEVWSFNGSAWTKIGGDSVNSGWTTNFEYVASSTASGGVAYFGLASSAGDAEVWRWNGSWSKIGGDAVNSSWADTTYEIVTTLMLANGYLYAGLGNSAAGEAEVWRCATSSSCTSWSLFGGDGTGSSWNTNYEQVWSLTSDGTNIYAGIGNTAGDNEVWKHNGSSWSQVGGDALNSGFTNTHTAVRTLTYTNSTLYAGLMGTGTSATMWSFNGSSWTLIGGNYINSSWGYTNFGSVESLVTMDGKLYAGNGVATAGNANVWEFDGTSWTRIGGQGINSSWTRDTYESIQSMFRIGSVLYVGLGSSAGDAEVWRYSGGSWTQIGGDSLNSGWTTNYDSVMSMAQYQGRLVVGLGISTNESEIWSWNGSTWSKIGGDGTNSSWNTSYETIRALVNFNGVLYAGLGDGTGDAEVWSYNGSTWSKIGGDGTNSSWNTVFETVENLAVYDNAVYAGLGSGAGDAEVWKWNGSAWSQIGGDGTNSSWIDSTYDRVRTMAVFNGELYAGLGSTAGEGEVWKWNGSAWSQIGGDSLNNGWASAHEHVTSFEVYSGKLYAGLGDTANVDAAIYAYGGNEVLRSTTTSLDTSWHHIAATYDGATMKLYIDGTLDSSASASLSMSDTDSALFIGSSHGDSSSRLSDQIFDGLIDELRISSTARSSFTTDPYVTTVQTVRPAAAVLTSGVKTWDSFTATESGGGTFTYRLSSDGGSTWKYYSSGWTTSASTSQANSASVINANIGSFPVTGSGFLWQAMLQGNGSEQSSISYVSVGATADNTAPSNPDTLTAQATSGGSSLTTDTWYQHTAPYFAWSGASDGSGAGVAGYYVYFGTDQTAEPTTAGSFQAGATYTASSLVSGSTYYLRIKTKDSAQNTSATTWTPFIYKFDNTQPTNPTSITVSPAGYTSTNSYTFSWPASGAGSATDSASQILGFQYKTATAAGALSDWSATTSATSISIDNAAYQTDANVFYLRSVDNAGNTQVTPSQINFYYSGTGPSAPRFLAVNPSENTSNSFAFSWQVPLTYSGNASDLTYCYTVNTLPSSSSCTYTSAGATSIAAGSFATQVGLNTFYLAAKNGADSGGAISYSNYTSVTFTANTSAPGIPLNLEASDVSIKSTSSWRIALSWTAPSSTGSGVANYKVWRSTDDVSYMAVSTTTGLAYIDTGLSQATYYYKISACDNVSNCGEETAAVDLLPTGRFTEAAALSSGPTVSSITTKKAIITWATDRESDSKVQFGTSPGSYFTEEPSNSDQTTDHSITLSNLSAGTTYYYKVKWTDEDGNTGSSSEKTFSTDSAPIAKEVTAKNVSLDSALIQFTVSGASSVDVHYGITTAFGGISSITTGTNESTYTVELEDLEDDTKYFFKVNALDTEGNVYTGTILSFTTLPRPKISTVRIQQIRGTAQPSVLVSWISNTETSSIVTFYPENSPASSRDEVNVALVKGQHKMLLKSLIAQTAYVLTVSGRDKAGNEAQSEKQRFTTATDTRPPQILNLKVEGTTQNSTTDSRAATAQLVVSWDTDEPGTGQVEFGEGTGTSYAQKTQEEATLTTNHLVIISGLTPSKVYHLRAISKDSSGNRSDSIDTVTITPKAVDNALDLVVQNLQQAFGLGR